MRNRYTLTRTNKPMQWRCCDFENLISCVFEEHKFNETQEFDVSETPLEPLELPKVLREMGDWLGDNHYEKIF